MGLKLNSIGVKLLGVESNPSSDSGPDSSSES